MKSEYTKGEWKVYKSQDKETIYVLAPYPKEHQTRENRNAEVVIARMMDAWSGGKSEQLANARLIAQAPKLYEALLLYLDDCEMEKLEYNDDTYNSAKQAIASVEGK